MKKALLLVSLLVFGLVGVAGATTWTDSYYADGFFGLKMSVGDTETVNFDLTDDGFDPLFYNFSGADVPVWAQVEIYVYDDLDRPEEYLTVSTGTFHLYNAQSYEVDYHGGIFNDPLLYDYGFAGLLDIYLDGKISLNLTATEGDFYFRGAKLTASDVAPVPEPGTLLLLGTGLAGLAFYRRKKMK